MMSPFEPADGISRWRIVYDLLVKVPTGGTITYEVMGEALGLDPETDRHGIQMAVRRAAREHEVADNRALDAVPNVGYRIVEAPEHLILARRHQRRAGRSLERGRGKVEHVDLSGQPPEVRQGFEVVAIALKMQADFILRLDIRQKRLEQQVAAAVSGQEHTSDELADLRGRLEKLEADRRPSD